MWDQVKAASVNVGDETPAGIVEAVDYYGAMERVELLIGGTWYTRRFWDLVAVKQTRTAAAR